MKIQEEGLISQYNHPVSLYVFHAEEPQTAISLNSLQLLHCLRPLITSLYLGDTLICILLKKCTNSLREQVGNWSFLFVDCLESIPS